MSQSQVRVRVEAGNDAIWIVQPHTGRRWKITEADLENIAVGAANALADLRSAASREQGERMTSNLTDPSVAPEAITHYVCPRCGEEACLTPNSDHLEDVYHRLPVSYVRADIYETAVAERDRLQDWANQYERTLLDVRVEAAVGTGRHWLLTNETFEKVRRALEQAPPDRAVASRDSQQTETES